MKRILFLFCLSISLLFASDCTIQENQAFATVIKYKQNSVIAKEQRQIECLADNIYNESKGEPYKGKVAVAFVTLNRTQSESFPDDVCGVVKHKVKNKYQFSWLQDKKKKAESKKRMVDKMDDVVYNESKKVAEYVYHNHNKITDPTKGALYFHANYVKVKRKGKIKKAVIGKHIFYNVKIKERI